MSESYNKRIVNVYHKYINNSVLHINNEKQRIGAYKIKTLEILQNFQITRLELHRCPNLVLKLQNQTLKELEIKGCNIDSIDELYLENLELLHLEDHYYQGYSTLTLFINTVKQPQDKLDIVNLTKCIKLNTLHLIGYKDIDIGPLNLLTGLIRLNLSDCGLKNINQLMTLIHLQELCLSQNNNIDLTSIQYLKSLKILDVRDCFVKNIEEFQELSSLKELNMESNIGVDISPLKHLTSLSTLNLSHCGLQNLNALTPLINLISLNVSSNEIIDISPLQFMKQLEFLDFYGNQILNIDVLRSLTSLQELNISNNPILYLAPLKEIKLNDRVAILNMQALDHPEIHTFSMFDEVKQPSQQQINLANTLRDLNTPITKLRTFSKYRICLKGKIINTQQSTRQLLHSTICEQALFTQRIVALFQQLSKLDNYM
ncbi:leucine-rich_repeat domain-containing protein [Hexamita inflata]|uniref:Leucine-rich repeat domain-containing protein n=1 Tax=Hexamita inflata TaxID=28002 RepID=A0AA86TYQ9_9EUKA|nr:leucine-rich repeat domain-containing protein [Hexamita inflata]